MKVTFVHLGRENLGIEYLSAVLKQEGHDVGLAYDPGLFGLSDNVFYIPFLERMFDRRAQVLEEIERSRPDVLGFSVYTGTYQWALDIAREAKARFAIPTIFGGIHPTLAPEEVVRRPEVDCVVVGEAEEALVELLGCLEEGRPPRGVANVWYRGNNEIVSRPVRPPVRDLDGLPLPDKALFEQEVDFGDDYMILAARGCPFHCTYCCESQWNRLYRGRYFRRRSVDSVIHELRVMKARYGFREVMFNEPIFFTERRWLRELMERYRAEIGVPFRCFGKAGFLDQEVAEWLRWGGCYAIEFGLQTFNPEIRKGVLGRPESNDDYRSAFAILDRVGIWYDIDHMFGLPGETLEDHVEGARLYGSLRRLNRIKCHNLTYFPGMEIVDTAREAGMLGEEDLGRITRGEVEADFFHRDSIQDASRKETSWDFLTLFRFLPILPRSWLSRILEAGRWRGWHRIPFPVTVLAQLIGAVRGRDYRYFLYLRYYLLRLRRAFPALPRARALLAGLLFGVCGLATIPVGNALKDWGAFHVAGILMAGVALRSLWAAFRKGGPR
jgi:anaerobic magnesium-protoporphyrin IX monomethyl ester cyclase